MKITFYLLLIFGWVAILFAAQAQGLEIVYEFNGDALLYDLEKGQTINLTVDIETSVEKPIISKNYLIFLSNQVFYFKDLITGRTGKLEEITGELFPPTKNAKPTLSPDGTFIAYEGDVKLYTKEHPKAKEIFDNVDSVIIIYPIIRENIDLGEIKNFFYFFAPLKELKNKNVISPEWVEKNGVLWLYWLEGKTLRQAKLFQRAEKEQYIPLKIIDIKAIPLKADGFSVPKELKIIEDLIVSSDDLYFVSKGKIYKYIEKEYQFNFYTEGDLGEIYQNYFVVLEKNKNKIQVIDAEKKEVIQEINIETDWFSLRRG